MTACPQCGRPLSEHERHVRFRLPDPAVDVPEHQRAGRTWGNDVLLQVEGVGSFVRVLVPVRLTGGYCVTFGAWLGVHPHDLRRAWQVWLEPEYARLRLAGVLANGLPGWEEATFARPLEAAVLDPEQVPYAVGSDDPFLRRVLEEEWPHEEILAAIAPL